MPPILSIRIAVAAAAAGLGFLLAGCETNQVKPPVDPSAVIWTKITDPSKALSPAYPDWRDSTIAFHYEPTFDPLQNNNHIGLVKPDGSGLVLYSELSATLDYFPTWVNDTSIVYTSNKGAKGGYLIWYRNLPSNTSKNLDTLSKLEFWPAPRPGSPSLVCVEGSSTLQGKLMLIADVAMPYVRQQLTPDTLKTGEPDWDAAGNRICFSAEDPYGARNIWLMTLSGTSIVSMRRLTTEGVHDRGPRFSPDGTKIAFWSDRNGKYGVWWVSPDSAQMAPRLIAFDDVENVVATLAWSPDGKELVVSSGPKTIPVGQKDSRALYILSNLGF